MWTGGGDSVRLPLSLLPINKLVRLGRGRWEGLEAYFRCVLQLVSLPASFSPNYQPQSGLIEAPPHDPLRNAPASLS